MDHIKTIRLFISSTFNDFSREREILHTRVFPHITNYAANKGYVFQPIDLRWGIETEAQLDHRTLELCLNEVKACKSYIPPNLLIMIGDRYGWIPLPRTIPLEEFNSILNFVNESEAIRLLDWYKKDLNQLPASYILKERTGINIDPHRWQPIENSLRTILQTAVINSPLSEENKRKYFLSATEAEVNEGIPTFLKLEIGKHNEFLNPVQTNKTSSSQQLFCFFREIDIKSKKGKKFVTDNSDYLQAQLFKKRVKKEIVNISALSSKTYQIDENNLDEKYLEDFERCITKYLESKVNSEAVNKMYSSLELELEAQSNFAINKRKNFLGQKLYINGVDEYLKSDSLEPLVIFGASGIGKSSIIAKTIEGAENNQSFKVLYRFVGATPNSSTSFDVLTSIFEELGTNLREQNFENFEEFSNKIYNEFLNIKDNVVFFIDAVDQFYNKDEFKWLPSKLPLNVKFVISTLNDEKYPEDSKYFYFLKSKVSEKNLLEIKGFDAAEKLIMNLLEAENRTLQKLQRDYALDILNSINSPLYTIVAVHQLKRWKGYDDVGGKNLTFDQKLPMSLHELFNKYIDNLSKLHHHNLFFVRRVLAYVCASRDGLSESELLTLIASDLDFIDKVAPSKFHQNHDNHLPLIHWSRLHAELKPFICLKNIDGEETMYFFHREIVTCISKHSWYKKEVESAISSLKKLIIGSQWEKFDRNRWGKLFLIYNLEYENILPDIQYRNDFVLFTISLNNIMWIEGFVDYLNTQAVSLKSEDGSDSINIQTKAVGILRSLFEIFVSLYSGSESISNDKTPEHYFEIKDQSFDDLIDHFLIRKLVNNLNELAYFYRRGTPIRNNESIKCLRDASNVTRYLFENNKLSAQWRNFHIITLQNRYYQSGGMYSSDIIIPLSISFELANLEYGESKTFLNRLVWNVNELDDLMSKYNDCSETHFIKCMARFKLRYFLEKRLFFYRDQEPISECGLQKYRECLELLIDNYSDPKNREIEPNFSLRKKQKSFIRISKPLYGEEHTFKSTNLGSGFISKSLYGEEYTLYTLSEVANRLGVGKTIDYIDILKNETQKFERMVPFIIEQLKQELNQIGSR